MPRPPVLSLTALLITSSTGTLSTRVTIPATAAPGTHWVTAVGRRSGSAAQAAFIVRTNQTQYGFDTVHSGTNPFENTITPATAGRLRQLWRVPTGSNGMESSPVVHGGVVYATFDDGTLRASFAQTGVLGSQTGKVSSVNTVTGALNWSTASEGGDVVALGTSDGSQRWGATGAAVIEDTPAYDDGVLYYSDDASKVHAVDAATGLAVWNTDLSATGEGLRAPVTVAGGLVYVGSSNTYLLRESDGVRVRTLAAGARYGGATVADATVTVGDFDDNQLLRHALPSSAAPTGRPSPRALRPTLGR